MQGLPGEAHASQWWEGGRVVSAARLPEVNRWLYGLVAVAGMETDNEPDTE